MRRFDRGYAAAKQRLDEGAIGEPVVFKSTSRDPFRPSVEYANPKSSGGMILDMGIHDFDLARWFMGEVAAVQAVGGVLAYPELGEVGDIDNAIISLVFASGRLGVVDLTRNGIYGYDITTELLGTEGTLRIGYLRETPLMVMTKGRVAHDTVPYFMERFARRLHGAARELRAERAARIAQPPITIDDGVEALRVAIAATQAREDRAARSRLRRRRSRVEPRGSDSPNRRSRPTSRCVSSRLPCARRSRSPPDSPARWSR